MGDRHGRPSHARSMSVAISSTTHELPFLQWFDFTLRARLIVRIEVTLSSESCLGSYTDITTTDSSFTNQFNFGSVACQHCSFDRLTTRIKTDPILYSLSNVSRLNKSVAQVLIRWSVQRGYITIPKSTKAERIVENSQVFDFSLSDDDMALLVSIDRLVLCEIIIIIIIIIWTFLLNANQKQIV